MGELQKTTSLDGSVPVNENDQMRKMYFTLKPVLSVVLRLTALHRPENPTDFIAVHMRHFRVCDEIPILQNASCKLCEAYIEASGGITEKSSDVLFSVILAKEARLQKGSWRDVTVTEDWEYLKNKFGEPLKWWHVARAIRRPAEPPLIPEVCVRVEHFMVYIFISSTFSDMHSERDFLICHVFPNLQQWCDERKMNLQIVPIDLRWGTTYDVCLELVQRCHKQNQMAYFLCILGDRYGWVPEDMPTDLRNEYCVIPGMSITASEIYTGALWERNCHALFMLRNTSVTEAAQQARYSRLGEINFNYESGSESERISLAKLKQDVRQQFPNNTFDYTATVAGLMPDDSTRLTLTDFKCIDGTPFEQRVLDFFQQQIQQQYFAKVEDAKQSYLANERKKHHEFMEARSCPMIGRQKEVTQIKEYIDQTAEKDTYLPLLVVSGPAGVGKTSLMANVSTYYSQKKDQATKVITHFVGIVPSSTRLATLLMRLSFECLDCDESEIPTDLVQLKLSLHMIFHDAQLKTSQLDASKKYVIFIDAIDQLDSEHDALMLHWLPKRVPHNVRLIVSVLTKASEDDSLLDRLRTDAKEKQFSQIIVQQLSMETRHQVVSENLKKFGKKLSENQLHSLLSKVGSGIPLWLTLACEELRIFGRFPTFENKVNSLGSDLAALIPQIIERVTDPTTESGPLVKTALSLLCASRFGLVESELRELLTIAVQSVTQDGRHSAGLKKTLSSEIWSSVRLQINTFLMPVRSASGCLDFYHRVIRECMTHTLLNSPVVQRRWYRLLASYFEKPNTSTNQRKAMELPWLLLTLNEKKALRQLYLNYDVFMELNKDDKRFAFITQWKQLAKDCTLIMRDYVDALKNNWLTTWASNQKEGSKQERIRLWGHQVLNYSSQLDDENGAAKNILGRASVHPLYGHYSSRTWSPNADGSRKEFIEVAFEKCIYVTAISVYETFNGGAIRKIKLRDDQGTWKSVYTVEKSRKVKRARIFRHHIERPKYKSDAVHIELDSDSCMRTIVQFDAVSIDGYESAAPLKSSTVVQPDELANAVSVKNARPKLIRQFVKAVKDFSSERDSENFGARRLIGRPSMYPRYVEKLSETHIWCPKEEGSSKEFLVLEFEKPVHVVAVELFEVKNGGTVSRIALQYASNLWFTAYESQKTEQLEHSRRFVPNIKRMKQATNVIRIEMDLSSLTKGWRYSQIDAVALFGYEGSHVEIDEQSNEIVKRYYTENPMYEDEGDDEEEKLFDSYIHSLTGEELQKWLDAAVTCARFFADLRAFAGRQGNDDFQALSRNIEIFVKWCYSLFHRIVPNKKSDPHFGELVETCPMELLEYLDEAISLFEARKDKRALITLYSAKGYSMRNQVNVNSMRQYFEKSITLGKDQIKYRSEIAKAHMLYAESLQRLGDFRLTGNFQLYEEAAQHYKAEHEILLLLLPEDHPRTILACLNYAKMLKKIGRRAEAVAIMSKYSQDSVDES